MKYAKELSRDEMKNVMAGTIEGCVQCITPNGAESWYRDDITTGPNSNIDDICNSIYPTYDGNVSATMSAGPCDNT